MSESTSETAESTDQTRSSSTTVVYRHVALASGAALQVKKDRSVFVAVDEPPPIRTVVQLWRGDEARAVVVQRIIEVPEEGEARGFFAVPAESQDIATATKVGTEHLETPVGTSPAGSDDGTADGSGSDVDPDANIAMAMPAPVVGDTDDEPEDGADADEDGESVSEPDGEGEGASDSSSSGPRRRGRGRGRKRK